MRTVGSAPFDLQPWTMALNLQPGPWTNGPFETGWIWTLQGRVNPRIMRL